MITVMDSKKASIEIQKIMLACSFTYSVPFGINPAILVFRNTHMEADFTKSYVPDKGDNSCDSVLLVDDKLIYVLSGRSYPHKKYQKQQADGSGAANYIASGYYDRAWRKGFHKGNRALVQNVKFTVWRSSDMELMDEDDYSETGIVADNFHGMAPFSAGCVTVNGGMNPPDGDWAIAARWIYQKPETFFDACILNHSDLKAEPSLRIGSRGLRVESLQSSLSTQGIDIKVDGDFGPYTHEVVRTIQKIKGIKDDGIVGPETAGALKINLAEFIPKEAA